MSQEAKQEINAQTNISVNGKLTVTVSLKGSVRRWQQPDLSVDIPINFGGKIEEIEYLIDEQLESLAHRVLIACGKEGIAE